MAAPRTRRTRGQKRRDEVEEWWILIVRILSFVLGAVILIGLVFFLEPKDKLTLTLSWVAALACLGPTVWPGAIALLEAIRFGESGGDSEDP